MLIMPQDVQPKKRHKHPDYTHNAINNVQDAQEYFAILSNAIIYDKTGKALEYCQLVKREKRWGVWVK